MYKLRDYFSDPLPSQSLLSRRRCLSLESSYYFLLVCGRHHKSITALQAGISIRLTSKREVQPICHSDDREKQTSSSGHHVKHLLDPIGQTSVPTSSQSLSHIVSSNLQDGSASKSSAVIAQASLQGSSAAYPSSPSVQSMMFLFGPGSQGPVLANVPLPPPNRNLAGKARLRASLGPPRGLWEGETQPPPFRGSSHSCWKQTTCQDQRPSPGRGGTHYFDTEHVPTGPVMDKPFTHLRNETHRAISILA